MRIQIANGDYPEKRLWLELPIENDPTMHRTISRLASLMNPGQTEADLTATDMESPVPNLQKYVMTEGFTNSIEQMHLLARKIEVMSGIDLRKFGGALDIESVNSIDDVHRIADSLVDYEWFPDVSTAKELGAYLVESGDVKIPESAMPYVDYARVGEEYYANNSCAYGDNCLIVKKYDNGPDRAIVFDLKVTSDFYEKAGAPPIRLILPASPEKLVDTAERLRLPNGDINKCRITEINCPIVHLRDCLPELSDVDSLNGLAIEVDWILPEKGPLMNLCAVLEAEKPENIAGALEITHHLDNYERINATHPADYGYHVLYETDLEARDIEPLDELKDFIDYEKYGEYRMEEDGVRQTDFGMVRRLSEPFEPEEGMTMTMK